MSMYPDFDDMLATRDAQQQQLAQDAPFVRTNPQSILKGSAASTLPVAYGSSPVQLAIWPGDDVECRATTVNFLPYSNQFAVDGSKLPLRPYGVVRFGTRGALATAYVDISHGRQFTVSASQVVLSAGLDSVGGAFTGAPPDPIQITGMISFGTVSGKNQVTRTAYIDDLNGGLGGSFVIVPPFAQNVVFQCADRTLAADLKFQDSQGNTSYLFRTTAGAQMDPIPINGGVAFIHVDLTTATTSTGCLVFGLSL